MKFGRIRVEDGQLIFTRHMVLNTLPVKDILWAYISKESSSKEDEKLMLGHELVIFTGRRKEYRFDMSEQEAENCVNFPKALNELDQKYSNVWNDSSKWDQFASKKYQTHSEGNYIPHDLASAASTTNPNYDNSYKA